MTHKTSCPHACGGEPPVGDPTEPIAAFGHCSIHHQGCDSLEEKPALEKLVRRMSKAEQIVMSLYHLTRCPGCQPW